MFSFKVEIISPAWINPLSVPEPFMSWEEIVSYSMSLSLTPRHTES